MQSAEQNEPRVSGARELDRAGGSAGGPRRSTSCGMLQTGPQTALALPKRSSVRVMTAAIGSSYSVGETFLDHGERVVDRCDTFTEDFLIQELRFLLIDRGGGEGNVNRTVGQLRELDGVELDGLPRR